MTSRRLRVLLENLPPESATWTALRNAMSPEDLAEHAADSDPEQGRWSQVAHLLAATVDAVRRVEYVLILANSDSKARAPKPPEPLPRPGVNAPKAKPRISEAASERLFQLINGGAQ